MHALAPKKDKQQRSSFKLPTSVLVPKEDRAQSRRVKRKQEKYWSCKKWTPEVSNQKRRGGQCTCFAFADLVTTILRMERVIGMDVFMSGQCLVDWGDKRLGKVKLFCCDPRLGFETTKDYPYEGVPRVLENDWSKLKYEGVPHALLDDWSYCQSKGVIRYVIDRFSDVRGKELIKDELEKHFRDGPGYPCIAYLNALALNKPLSQDELERANHVVLIVALDLRSDDENRHCCHIKNSWGRNWHQQGFDDISFDVIKTVFIPHYTPSNYDYEI